MSYKDKTYCPQHVHKACSKASECERVLSKDELKDINVTVAYYRAKPGCFKEEI